MSRSEIRYAETEDGLEIAYQTVAGGPVDLVFVSGFITHLDLSWELPHFAWLEQLDGVARVITFDKRGTGLSDRSLGFGSVEERARDIAAVMDAAGSRQAFLCGVSEGGPMSVLFAASFPERVRGLVLFGTAARFSNTDDYRIGHPPEQSEIFLRYIVEQWGTGRVFQRFLQNASNPEAARALLARFERNACTPRKAADIMRRNLEIDIRPMLPAIAAPTLVLHAAGDPVVPVACGRYLAEHINGARLVEFEGDYHASWNPVHVAELRDAVVGFLALDDVPARPVSRVLATVMFTDIVGSTERASRLGDTAWRLLLDQHDRIVQAGVERFGGRLVKNTGDGVLATFDGPSRGIDCARAVAEALRPYDLRIRAGIHTGEVELHGDDVAGLGVVIASRICDLADGDQVLVSRTVKDLVAGSGIKLVEHGTHRLKGVPDDWQLYAAG